MINLDIVEEVDKLLDRNTTSRYITQPLAQHWARVGKIQEEAGEAIAELISWTGQNPRKPEDGDAFYRMLAELADTALTAVYAIQHFTHDAEWTESVMAEAQKKHVRRLRQVAQGESEHMPENREIAIPSPQDGPYNTESSNSGRG